MTRDRRAEARVCGVAVCEFKGEGLYNNKGHQRKGMDEWMRDDSEPGASVCGDCL